MITDYEGVAIDLSTLKAIRMDDMKLIFEFKSDLQYVQHPETEERELHTVVHTPLEVEFKIYDHLSQAYYFWVETWQDFKNS